MSPLLLAGIVVVVVVPSTLAIRTLIHRSSLEYEISRISVSRILFPYLPQGLSTRALEAALRLARAENATLVPVFLLRVPLELPLEAPLPRLCAPAIPLQEAIEQRAAAFGVAVDARIERGRSYRHALRETIDGERFDRIVLAAATPGGPGFGADDVAWLLQHASGEIIVLRPSGDQQLAPARSGRRRPAINGRAKPVAPVIEPASGVR